MAKDKKQTKADNGTLERRIYRLPEGKWKMEKADISGSQVRFRFWPEIEKDELPEAPTWSIAEHWQRFGVSDLRKIYAAPLTHQGAVEVLNLYGPWTMPEGCVSLAWFYRKDALDFGVWRWWALEVKRAYWLFLALKSGEHLVWEVLERGHLSYLRIANFRHSWSMSADAEPENFWIDLELYPHFSDVDVSESHVSRTLGKALLAQLIHQGLGSVSVGFEYFPDIDSFRSDIGELVTVSLSSACWLVLRDLSANLRHLRFCESCSKPLPPTMKSHAMVCPVSVSPACQKAYYRKRKAAKNGQT